MLNLQKTNAMEKFDLDIQPNKKNISTLNYRLIIIIVLALFILGGGIYWFLNRNDDTQSINDEVTEQTTEQDVEETNEKVIDSTDINQMENSGMESDTTQVETEQNPEATETTTEDTQPVQNAENTTKEVNTNTSANGTDLKYFIVNAAFKVENNAQNKKAALQNQGYQAIIVGPTPNGLFIVAYEGFSDINAAKEKLKEIRQTNSQAWIYKKQ